MKARVQKWGNSLALRIPKSFAQEIGLSQDGLVELTLAEDKLIVSPVSEPSFTLEELLARINSENIHGEIDTEPPVGKEVW